jgi:DNA helicase II / ATP-dependent DNA helicase PcrA
MGEIKLNEAQQKAVEYIYGPLLVLAGPGTGKTQLLSARIANILQKTDVNAQNILCLTFTEAAAQNMRERLASIIKDDAYDVHINTYHGFGSDIIRSYPEYFEEIDLETGKDSRLEKPIDDLKRIQILDSVINKLPYSSPLIDARRKIKNLSSTISDLKRYLYTPESLRKVANDNLTQVRELSPQISEHIGIIKSFPRTAEKSIELFSGVLEILENNADNSLVSLAVEELKESLTSSLELNKSKPLTEWKNRWLSKNSDDNYVFTDEKQHLRIAELANIYENYQKELEDNQMYDFDDMILRTIDGLKNKSELKYNLQEKYQFILLDEFQDTNAAQFELVKLLADNPVNEGKPNIFAVGDDDQAIYAFQGANVSNMLGFKNEFRDVAVISLTENYRSHHDIIHTAHNISEQIESRLHKEFKNVEKTLIASSKNLPENSTIQRHEFSSEANEYAWVSNEIKKLVNQGFKPSEITVLAPKHKILEGIVPFLAKNKVPISYEKREDILGTQMMQNFRVMIELIISLQEGDIRKSNELFPRVLSIDFYQIPTMDIWQTNWSTKRIYSEVDIENIECNWANNALNNDNIAPHIEFYLALAMKSYDEPLEFILDYLVGSSSLVIGEENVYTSPMKQFYFSDKVSNPLEFYEALTNLSTIREHLRVVQSREEKLLNLQNFLDFIHSYEVAEQPLINTHPISQAKESVQLMTVYKAKGLEFEHVFLLSVHDDIWGKKAKTSNNVISLPANLEHVRYKGSSEDELRRILFVAVTRAKHGLYLTSYATKDNGKATEPVKYLLEFTEGDARKSTVLPEDKQVVDLIEFKQADAMKNIDTMWHSRHIKLDTNLKSLVLPRLENYKMSPTHLNSFIDMEYGGPEEFLLQTILRFPKAPGEDGEFGNAVHYALERHHNRAKKDIEQTIKDFDSSLIKRYIPKDRIDDFRARGHKALRIYLPERKEMFDKFAKSEVDFRLEGVVLDTAQLSGKIDRLEIDTSNKTVSIVDFKTGKPLTKWDNSIKSLKYKQQLYFYKFLIEGSHTWQNYKVVESRLEFVEPDSDGELAAPLKINFDDKEEEEMKKLIVAVWDYIKSLNFPDTSKMSNDYNGTVKFTRQLTDQVGVKFGLDIHN